MFQLCGKRHSKPSVLQVDKKKEVPKFLFILLIAFCKQSFRWEFVNDCEIGSSQRNLHILLPKDVREHVVYRSTIFQGVCLQNTVNSDNH